MKPKNDTGPTSGTFIFSLSPRRELSGLNNDSKQNAVLPRNVSPMRLACAAVSSLALAISSGESFRRPWWLRPVSGGFLTISPNSSRGQEIVQPKGSRDFEFLRLLL